MGTLGSKHEGKGPNLGDTLEKELPHGGVAGNKERVELTDATRERIANAIDEQPISKRTPSKPTGGSAFNSGSTYKPN